MLKETQAIDVRRLMEKIKSEWLSHEKAYDHAPQAVAVGPGEWNLLLKAYALRKAPPGFLPWDVACACRQTDFLKGKVVFPKNTVGVELLIDPVVAVHIALEEDL